MDLVTRFGKVSSGNIASLENLVLGNVTPSLALSDRQPNMAPPS